VLGWQSSGFDGWMWHSTLPLINLQLREFVFFTCYATAGLLSLVSSFLFTLLEFYGLSFSTCDRTPSFWWRSSSTSIRCLSGCSHRLACSGYSMCCGGLGRAWT
jgi:hypothetical protein